MVELYATRQDGETIGVFSTMEKAKRSVEREIRTNAARGYYGIQFMQEVPELTWRKSRYDYESCGFTRPGIHDDDPVEWRECGPVAFPIQLDPDDVQPDAGHEGFKPQCPEGLLINGVELHRCVRDGGHEGPHWSRDRQREWPRLVLAEVECPW